LSSALTPRQATESILARLPRLGLELRPLRQCVGRILRQDVQAERDNPPFDRVCMDGVAIASMAFADGLRQFRLQATQAAGAVPLALASPADAIEVMTGAVMPRGTDCVVPLEEYALTGSTLVMGNDASAEPWRNVQRRGCDSRPGVPMLTAGMRLGAAEVAVVASAGLAQVQVSCQPRLMVVSTGDELIEPGAPIAAHQVRRSNAYAVAAALQAHGFEFVHDDHLRDDEVLMRRRLGEHLETHDVLVLSGGISKGRFDYVPGALKHLGVQEIFTQVAQRPGRPMWFGIGPRGQAVFGLPGNPVSTLICLVRYVLPALSVTMGARVVPVERVAFAAPMSGRRMTYFMPVALVAGATMPGLVSAHPPQGSGDFLALAGTDGFAELAPQPEGYAAGLNADFYRW
jgi:molybdopterin molybdotransferase